VRHSLSLTVHVDLDLHEVILAVAGCLTARTYVSLLPMVAQARALDPVPRLTLDLLGTQHIDEDGLVHLRRAIALADPEGTAPLDVRAPTILPPCPVRSPAPQLAPGATDPAGLPEGARRGIAPRSRREEILTGAAEMFAEHGYHGASLRDIARHIGISHPGMMHHFPSKDDLLHCVIDELEDCTQRIIDDVERMSTSPEALLEELAATWHEDALPVRLLAALAAESVSVDHPGHYRMARLRRVHENIFEQCFTAFDAQGLLRTGLDPGFAGRALLGLVLNLAIRERTVRTMQGAGHDDGPLQELARMMRSFLSRGAMS